MSYDLETVDDALSAVELATTLPEIDPQKIFVLGHSLGGMLAPRIAERTDDLAGIIMLAASARPMETLLQEQLEYLAPLQGFTKEQIPLLIEQTRNSVPPSYWTFANEYQPAQVAVALELPILILQGERDYQATMEDFNIFQRTLSEHQNVLFRSYPKLNHLFQEGEGKATPQEYLLQATPVASYVIDDIATFINEQKL
jgi:dipeptidyl aminopeptidase/acylaminoacyl peptidase